MLGLNFYRVFFLGLGIVVCGLFPTYEAAAQKSSTARKGGASQAKPNTPSQQPSQKQEVEWKTYSLERFSAECMFPSAPSKEEKPNGAAVFSSFVNKHQFSVIVVPQVNPQTELTRERMATIKKEHESMGRTITLFENTKPNYLHLETIRKTSNNAIIKSSMAYFNRPDTKLLFIVEAQGLDEEFDKTLAMKFIAGLRFNKTEMTRKPEVQWKVFPLTKYSAECLFPNTPSVRDRSDGGAIYYFSINGHLLTVATIPHKDPFPKFNGNELDFIRKQQSQDKTILAFKLEEPNILYLEAIEKESNGIESRLISLWFKRPGMTFVTTATAKVNEFDRNLAGKFITGLKMW